MSFTGFSSSSHAVALTISLALSQYLAHRELSTMFHRWRGHAQSASGLMASQAANSYPGAAPVNRPFMGTTASPSNAPRYDPFPSRNPTLPLTTPVPHTSAPAALPRPGRSTFHTLGCCEVTDFPDRIAIRFKPSPFFQIDQPVSSIAECPGISCLLTNIAPLNSLQSLPVPAIVVSKFYYLPLTLIKLQS
jgi:hypothetical protein